MSYYIIIRGPLGSGKSTIAKRLSKILNAKYFAVDRILDEHKLAKDEEEGYVSQRSFFKVNKIITPKAKKFLDKGKVVIFDGDPYWKSAIEDLISKLNYRHYVFTLKAPVKLCIERDAKRKKTHGKDAARVVHKKSTSFNYGITIDTKNKTPNKIVKEILKYLKIK